MASAAIITTNNRGTFLTILQPSRRQRRPAPSGS